VNQFRPEYVQTLPDFLDLVGDFFFNVGSFLDLVADVNVHFRASNAGGRSREASVLTRTIVHPLAISKRIAKTANDRVVHKDFGGREIMSGEVPHFETSDFPDAN
jgi:hypothetical protein